jgi:membrane-associated phospholipid phosphatase
VSRLAGRPTATDLVLVAYCAAAALLLALDGRPLGERRLELAAGHALVAALALALGFADRGEEGGFRRFAHRWLPLVAIAWLYGWAGEMRNLVVTRDLDGLVEGWDEALFPGHWHAWGARLPLPAIELAHAVYFSYYLLLFVPALAAGRRAARESDRYLFWLTLAMVVHYALNLFFPVAGPLASRRATMPAGVVFVPLMDGFYGAFDRGGLAFPSTHVVAAMVASWFAGRVFFPRAAWAYLAWFAAIAASTVVCGYHYPIDVAAGLATGGLCVALARRGGTSRPAGARAAGPASS